VRAIYEIEVGLCCNVGVLFKKQREVFLPKLTQLFKPVV